jgi:hypothetical protein
LATGLAILFLPLRQYCAIEIGLILGSQAMTFADYIANLCVGRLLETGLTDMAHLVQELRECAAEITDAEVLSAWVGLHQPNCRPAARDALWGAYESFASIAR